MHSRIITALAVLAGTALAAPAQIKRDLPFDYNNDKVRGVNLGGWFVLEPWITPSLFSDWSDGNSVVDEYTFCKTLGQGEAQNRLNQHWSTWFTQSDFQAIAATGMNHVRIPIGYWAVAPQQGDPYVQGQLQYLDQAINWARSSGLKVLLDIHGLPGSQNGFDNSGQRGNINWQSADPNRDLAKSAVDALSGRYLPANGDVITMIQPVNEPANWGMDMNYLKQYYYDAWGTVRNHSSDAVVVIHDAFEQPDTYWNGFMSGGSGVNNVALDTHQYQVFSNGELSRSLQDHVNYACGTVGNSVADTDKWTIVGEWSAALTDCAQWLNGLGKGARYDGSFSNGQDPQNVYGTCTGKYQGTVDGFSDQQKQALRQYIEAQLDAYERHTGWIYWTWKAESAPEWAMQPLLQAGLFPQPLTDRRYPNQCSGTQYGGSWS